MGLGFPTTARTLHPMLEDLVTIEKKEDGAFHLPELGMISDSYDFRITTVDQEVDHLFNIAPFLADFGGTLSPYYVLWDIS